MSQNNPIRVFVTHTFADHPDYHRVFEYLESSTNFYYLNCGAPDRIPSVGGKEALKDELRSQIKDAEVVIVLSSLYEQNPDLLLYQMNAAQANDLPIIALEPFGGLGKVPTEVANRAAEIVGWNDRLIVDALRREARHEETSRWDVIDFQMPD